METLIDDAQPHVPPIFVVGKARHGKSTARQIISRLSGMQGGSCSDSIYSVWSLLVGVAEEELRLVPKEVARPLMIAVGNWLTTEAESYETHFPWDFLPNADPRRLETGSFPRPNPGALIQYGWQNGVRVLDGVRREEELVAAVPALTWCGVKPFVIWVFNPRVQDTPDNFNLSRKWTDFGIVNDGNVDELEDKCRTALHFYRHKVGGV